MKYRELKAYMIEKIVSIYGEREAINIVEIALADIFGLSAINVDAKQVDLLDIDRVIDRLLRHEPIQYITGKTNFYGYDFAVNPSVLIPRPETEELVHWVLSDHRPERKLIDVLDIGTGSGCIPITLKKKRPNWRVTSVDKSVDALNAAQINAQNLDCEVIFYEMDFLSSETRSTLGLYDLIISNPPYIAQAEFDQMSQNVKDYEPLMALVPQEGNDPLIFYRQIADFCLSRLKPNGAVYLELNEFLAEDIKQIYSDVNWVKEVEIRHDMQGKKRMLKATKSA